MDNVDLIVPDIAQAFQCYEEADPKSHRSSQTIVNDPERVGSQSWDISQSKITDSMHRSRLRTFWGVAEPSKFVTPLLNFTAPLTGRRESKGLTGIGAAAESYYHSDLTDR